MRRRVAISRLTNLREAVRTGRSRWLKRLLKKPNYHSPTHFGEGTAAWGQYLDDDLFADQYGVYATSVAMQVLHQSKESALAQEAFTYLTCALDPKVPSKIERVIDNRDLLLKHSSLLWSLRAAAGFEGFEAARLIVQNFLDRARDPKGGWAFYATGDNRRGERQVIPTAHVLLGLKHSGDGNSSGVGLALDWFATLLGDPDTLRPAELSLVLHTLKDYAREDTAQFTHALEFHLDRLRKENSAWLNYMYSYPVELTGHAEPEHRYHVINARVCHFGLLMALGDEYLYSPQFFERLEGLASELGETGALRDPLSGRIETRLGCLVYLMLGGMEERLATQRLNGAGAALARIHRNVWFREFAAKIGVLSLWAIGWIIAAVYFYAQKRIDIAAIVVALGLAPIVERMLEWLVPSVK